MKKTKTKIKTKEYIIKYSYNNQNKTYRTNNLQFFMQFIKIINNNNNNNK